MTDPALTVRQKVSLLAGATVWATPELTEPPVPALVMSDGPSGVRGGSFISGRSDSFPCGTALAASWDPELVGRVAESLGRAAAAQGTQVLLGPTVNLHRHPLGGRNFECFSEDPHLTARMAVAYVTGVQRQGVACCVKHLVANDSEFERHTISSDVDEAVLRELYLAPFEAAVRSGVWSIMSAYNRVNGTYASESRWLLTTVLRDEWGFDGVVVSDWFGTHTTAPALTAGLDIEMPGPSRFRGEQLLAAVAEGSVSPEVVDRAAERVLKLITRTARSRSPRRGGDAGRDPDRQTLIRDAGARAMVLLRNDGLLPIHPGNTRLVALIGPAAATGRFQGGGSAGVNPTHLSGIRGAFEGAFDAVVLERGCVIPEWPTPLAAPAVATSDGEPGLRLSYHERARPDGPPLATETGLAFKCVWLGTVLPERANADVLVRVHTILTSPDSGTHRLSIAGTGSARVLVDDRPLTCYEGGTPSGDIAFDLRSIAVGVDIELTKGVGVDLVVEFEPAPSKGLTQLEVALIPPDPPDLIDRAVATATTADIAVVVLDSPPGWETEGRDRPSMSACGRQDELVERVAAANARTVVVLNTASPTLMPWRDKVAAIVQMWFPGQELGASLVDVLTGVVNPSGKLPTTFPASMADIASDTYYPGMDGHMPYGERFDVGYRHTGTGRPPAPLFAFGHGLSYSRFELGEPTVRHLGAGDQARFELSVPVTNIAGPAGREVVQVYIATGRTDRPALELKGFAGVRLDPGQTTPAVIAIARRDLRRWTEDGWRALDTPLTVKIGTSSASLPIQISLTDDLCSTHNPEVPTVHER